MSPSIGNYVAVVTSSDTSIYRLAGEAKGKKEEIKGKL